MREADQTPFATDGRQTTRKKRRNPRASVLCPNTGSPLTLRLASHALPAGVRIFAAMRSCPVTGVAKASA